MVVIPVHKESPTAYELISFEQCFKVLGGHPIVVVAPLGLNIENYSNIAPGLQVKWVEPKWMGTLLDYNKLKMSRFFYKMFSGYEYMLTYELDAFVFEDRLDYWCNSGYDFIGAPRFDKCGEQDEQLTGVGGSGFSLRRIESIKKAIKEVYYIDPTGLYSKVKSKYLKHTIKQLHLLMNYFSAENTTLQNALLLKEDSVIGGIIGKTVKEFNISPLGEAMHFSFEGKPEVLFEMNGRHLPMGCHAWMRYNLAFWKPYIERFGYRL